VSRTAPLVSILIDNYNYGRFLREAIESALNQTYRDIEVIVVDDGSTDDSRGIIASYGDRIIPVLKENGGHASAMNAGVAASRGDFVCLLDSDDFFYPEKVETVQRIISSKFSTKPLLLYHLLDVVDNAGHRDKVTFPERVFTCEPNLLDYARKYAFVPFVSSPTSGITIERTLARRIFPIPEVRMSAEDFVVRAAALLGEIHGIPQSLAAYRRHGNNAWLNSRPLKSVQYMETMDTYLNRKLTENNLPPSIDFFKSMYGRPYAEGSISGMWNLAWAVVRRWQDRATFLFFFKTQCMALKCLLRGLCRPVVISVTFRKGP
jgi:glycosyltransferase involved in cell wall biosynthesis